MHGLMIEKVTVIIIICKPVRVLLALTACMHRLRA